MTDGPQKPLPKELLPAPLVNSDPDKRDQQIERLMANADPLLAHYRTNAIPWWIQIAELFRTRLTVAAVSAAVLAVAVHFGLPITQDQSEGNLPLTTLITDVQPSAFLPVANSEADPALALVLLEGVQE